MQGFKGELVDALTAYVQEDYGQNIAFPTVFIEDGVIGINISCHNLKLNNFWGGEWLSTWRVQYTPGSDSFILQGKIRIHCHYFELGNIRFDLAKNYQDEINGSAVDGSIAKGITETIKKLEEEYQVSLENVYEDLNNKHIKELRRKMPFTGQTFDWSTPKLL